MTGMLILIGGIIILRPGNVRRLLNRFRDVMIRSLKAATRFPVLAQVALLLLQMTKLQLLLLNHGIKLIGRTFLGLGAELHRPFFLRLHLRRLRGR